MGFIIENGVLKKYTEEQGVTDVVIPTALQALDMRLFICAALKH